MAFYKMQQGQNEFLFQFADLQAREDFAIWDNTQKRFLRQIKKARHELKYNRENFWRKNKINFINNIKTLLSFFKFPEGWTVNIIASHFLLDKEAMPYDKDVWSFSDIIAATKNQGFDIIIFFDLLF